MSLLAPPPPPRRTPPRRFTMHDYQRSYVLFDDVDTNIPRWGTEGEPGAWNHARGLLIEVSRHLGGEPVALHYRERETPVHRNPIGTEITAVARDHRGDLITVVSTTENAPYGARGDHWQLAINGRVPDNGIATYPPSLPWIANLVARTVHR